MRYAMLTAVALLGMNTAAMAEVTVTLTEMHICCGACVRGINSAAGSVDGVTVTVSQADKSAKLVATDEAAAQASLDALAAKGYHAKSDHGQVVMKDDSGAKSGTVSRLEVTDVHNCCGGCASAITKAVKSVPGVQANTVKSKATEFVVEGQFDPAALVKSLNDAGFHVKVK